MSFTLHHGDCLAVLRAMPDNSVDSIVTDPPYGLSFMAKKWDYDVPSVDVWAECLRVLKPGGHMLAFAGTRTQHRMAVRIEDAGFEIRDMIAWVYGSGFPKSRNLSGDWQGWGTALKPALEPITVARKPLMSASINVLQMVESQLRERGVRGEIMWKPENVSGAAKKKSRKSSLSTNQPQAAETSAGNAGENETPSEGLQIVTSSEQSMLNGEMQTVSTSASTTRESVTNCATKCSTPTVESVHVAERQSETFSPSTTSTAEVQPTEKQSTEKSTTNSGEMDSPQDTECFVGIATGLTGSMAHVRINLDSSGFFIWPQGLPKHIAGSPLTVAANVLAHGTGAINVDACRVGDFQNTTPSGVDRRNAALAEAGYRPGTYQMGEKTPDTPPGRWPANLIHDGSDEVVALFPAQAGAAAPVRGTEASTASVGRVTGKRERVQGEFHADKGSAARFFYCAKASKRDRDEGLDGFEVKKSSVGDNRPGGDFNERLGKTPGVRANVHPTVKPTDLMAYLCRLVTPPGGVVLDPFMGSGSTGKAAMREGFRFIGIEREHKYLEIARARIAAAANDNINLKSEAV